MKRISLFFALLMLLALVIALAVGQVAAEPQFPVVLKTMTICARGTPERMWFGDLTFHGRNMLQNWLMTSSDPRFVGSGHDIVNWNINLETMQGVSWGDYVLYNENGLDGWAGKWQGTLTPMTPPVYSADGMAIWLFEGRGEGHGFGQYHGLQEHFEVQQSVSVFPADAVPEEIPCVTGYTWDGQVYVMQNDTPVYITGQAE